MRMPLVSTENSNEQRPAAPAAKSGDDRAAAPTLADLPVVDLAPYLVFRDGTGGGEAEAAQLCGLVAQCLRESGVVIVRDPRCPESDNAAFVAMLQSYFAQPRELLEPDIRPDLHYQLGATPAGIETPRCLGSPASLAAIAAQPCPPRMPTGPDPKWRFFHRVGPRPQAPRAHFAEADLPAIVPAGFPAWTRTMDAWGGKLLSALEVVAEMTARGLGLPADALTSRLHQGPHLVAPTGSDLGRDDVAEGTVFAGYHYDLNCLTVHGRSNFPGLAVWHCDGRRLPVSVPPGCLLLQAGMQLEYLTGGVIQAGYHEVVASAETMAAVGAARAAGRPLWRVSSTVFALCDPDVMLEPLGAFRVPGAVEKYRPTYAGDYVHSELEVINLKSRVSM